MTGWLTGFEIDDEAETCTGNHREVGLCQSLPIAGVLNENSYFFCCHLLVGNLPSGILSFYGPLRQWCIYRSVNSDDHADVRKSLKVIVVRGEGEMDVVVSTSPENRDEVSPLIEKAGYRLVPIRKDTAVNDGYSLYEMSGERSPSAADSDIMSLMKICNMPSANGAAPILIEKIFDEEHGHLNGGLK